MTLGAGCSASWVTRDNPPPSRLPY
jgi:hypothetical protein